MWEIFRIFAAEMTLDLYINEANDYARDIRVPVLHPHVAIIHYDEAGEIRHSLNRINCYGIDEREGMAAAFDGRAMESKPVRLAFKSVGEQDGTLCG